MAVYEIFSHPEYRRYKTHICSLATLFQFFCILLTFIPPLLIAYSSYGFWNKIDSYHEHPQVHFKHEILVVLDTSSDGNYVAWSTYPNFNQLQMEHLRVPLIKSREEDSNGDGINDLLYFQLEMPMDTEQVLGVKLMLIFDYKLYKMSKLQMESLVFIHYTSPIWGAALETVGDLGLHLREPLAHKGSDTRYNESIIDEDSVYADAFDLPSILQSYSDRNVTTYLRNEYPVWTGGRGAGKPFVVKATIRYPEEFNILYTPGFWELIKFSWIQYLAVLLIFLFVFDRIKIFVFQHQLVTTIMDRPWKNKLL